jgi:aldehyde dehydrogenase (NAD+)
VTGGESDFGNLIGGQWARPGATRPNRNRSDLDDVFGDYGQSEVVEAEAAIAAARAAAVAWGLSSPQVRFDLLDRAGTLILERRPELGQLLAREEGKTLAEATAEVMRAGQIFKYFAGEALRQTGDVLASLPGTSRSPSPPGSSRPRSPSATLSC